MLKSLMFFLITTDRVIYGKDVQKGQACSKHGRYVTTTNDI